jgi:hypothetical protein
MHAKTACAARKKTNLIGCEQFFYTELLRGPTSLNEAILLSQAAAFHTLPSMFAWDEFG